MRGISALVVSSLLSFCSLFFMFKFSNRSIDYMPYMPYKWNSLAGHLHSLNENVNESANLLTNVHGKVDGIG